MDIGLKEVRVSSSNLVPSLSTKNCLLSVTAHADRKKYFWHVREKALSPIFDICPRINFQDSCMYCTVIYGLSVISIGGNSAMKHIKNFQYHNELHFKHLKEN